MSMTIKQAIRVLHLPGDHLKDYEEYGLGVDDELNEAMLMAIAALREKAERDDPKPLTLEELRQMVGEPVYVVPLDRKPMCAYRGNKGEWCVVSSWFDNTEIELEIPGDECNAYLGEKCGKTFLAYRHKPKEG